MARISGIDIPKEKKNKIALTAIYGLGRHNVLNVLKKAKVDPEARAANLKPEEIVRLQVIIDKMRVEGTLREEIRNNIERLKRTRTYRGLRHQANLPVRGQRTRSNARTKRGKRVTIGAIKKKEMTKMGREKKGESGGQENE